jgi:hypothetical protein
VIGEPPLLAGASHETLTWALPATPVTPPGALGTVRGVAAAATTADDAPFAEFATSETTYDVPFTRPTMLHVVGAKPLRGAVVEQVKPPGVAVAV